MKRLIISTAAALPLVLASASFAQTTPPADKPVVETPARVPAATPGTTMGSTPAPMTTATDRSNSKETVRGWSVKDKIMGKSVYNENDEKVGDVADIVLQSNGQVEYFVIGAGGFLGMGQHDVAIPFDKIQYMDDKLTLRGYTKDQLKALPKVDVTQ